MIHLKPKSVKVTTLLKPVLAFLLRVKAKVPIVSYKGFISQQTIRFLGGLYSPYKAPSHYRYLINIC